MYTSIDIIYDILELYLLFRLWPIASCIEKVYTGILIPVNSKDSFNKLLMHNLLFYLYLTIIQFTSTHLFHLVFYKVWKAILKSSLILPYTLQIMINSEANSLLITGLSNLDGFQYCASLLMNVTVLFVSFIPSKCMSVE